MVIFSLYGTRRFAFQEISPQILSVQVEMFRNNGTTNEYAIVTHLLYVVIPTADALYHNYSRDAHVCGEPILEAICRAFVSSASHVGDASTSSSRGNKNNLNTKGVMYRLVADIPIALSTSLLRSMGTRRLTGGSNMTNFISVPLETRGDVQTFIKYTSSIGTIPNVDDRNSLPIDGYLAYVPAGDNRCLFYKIKNYPTIELNIHELERLSLSPRQTNDVSRYVVVNADKMRETRREYKAWMSAYSFRVPVPVGEFTFQAGRRWHLEFVKLRPDKNWGDSETKIDALYNNFFNQDI